MMSKAKLLESPSVSFWLKKAAHSPRTVKTYLYHFNSFLEATGLDPEAVVSEWQKIRYDYAERERFLDRYADVIERFYYDKLQAHTPKAKLTTLAAILSFFRHNKIPVEVDINERTYIVNHNRAILKSEILRILDHATLRDKSFFLLMLESGLRPQTIVMLRYKHIRKDFEANKIPMMIELDPEMLKDNVSRRFTFLGDFAFQTLKEYLTPRQPMKDDDVVFTGVHKQQQKGAYLSPNLFSLQFAKIVQKLNLSQKKEGRFRRELILYTLRKYFRNNLKTSDPAYVQYWMGHSLKTDAAYFDSWMEDPNIVEKHRLEYSNAYKLYGLQQNFLQTAQINEDLQKKDQEIKDLKDRIEKIEPFLAYLEDLQKSPDLSLEFFVRSWLKEYEKGLTQEEGNAGAALTEDLSKKLAETLAKSLSIELSRKKRKS